MSIKYSTYLSNLKKGDKPCYVARMKHNGTVAQNAFLKAVAEKSGESDNRDEFPFRLREIVKHFPEILQNSPSMVD